MTLPRLAEWIRGHGMAVTLLPTGVNVAIPWVDRRGRSGVDWHLVKTYKEALKVLGY